MASLAVSLVPTAAPATSADTIRVIGSIGLPPCNYSRLCHGIFVGTRFIASPSGRIDWVRLLQEIVRVLYRCTLKGGLYYRVFYSACGIAYNAGGK